jgi:hypothetical protein
VPSKPLILFLRDVGCRALVTKRVAFQHLRLAIPRNPRWDGRLVRGGDVTGTGDTKRSFASNLSENNP